MTWDEMAVVGRIARAHGIRGQVIVNLDTDFPEDRFQEGAELFVQRPAQNVEAVVITSVRFQNGRPVIGLQGVEDMNAAEALAGTELRVPVDRLMPLPNGAYYHHDLAGCTVETVDGRRVGIVAGVEGSLESTRLLVDAGDGGEVQVPFNNVICTTIDVPARRIVIDPPEGLIELNAKG